MNAKNLSDFLSELYHEDHGNEDMNVVVLSPEEPHLDMLLLLRQPHYDYNVMYLKGSALTPKDLQRAKLELADGVFILVNKFTRAIDEEDNRTMLQHLCIRKYLSLVDHNHLENRGERESESKSE